MTLTEFYERTSYTLRGTDEDAPTHGDEDAVYWLNTLNRKKDELYEDVTRNWRNTFEQTSPNEPGTVATTATTTLTGTSTFFTDYKVGDTVTVSGETVRTIATITSNTVLTVTVAFSNTASSRTYTHANIIATGVQSYSIPRTLLTPSINPYVTDTSGNRIDLNLIVPEEQNINHQEVYLNDEFPTVLTFTVAIASTDNMIGGTLNIPGYYMPADLTAATDILPFPDANWACLSVAAEIGFNDITYEDKVEGLNTKANNLYAQMVRKNRSLVYGNTRKVPTVTYKLRGF